MNWKKLLDFRCAKGHCTGCLSEPTHNRKIYVCDECEFVIRKSKFNEIINKMQRPNQQKHYRDHLQNLSDLNNLGRDKVADDFSDSPALNY